MLEIPDAHGAEQGVVRGDRSGEPAGIVTARAAVVWPEGKENWSRRAVYWGNPDSDGKVAGSLVWQLDGQAARAAAPLEFGV